jgi:cellulose synthase/poly-beta-1,6-N-acetylglucosamine synthase-like glycosyltransferase
MEWLWGAPIASMLISSVFASRFRPVAERGESFTLRRSRPVSVISSRIDVVIPAYNEEINIELCVRSVLESSALTSEQLVVWVVDDQSSDETGKILARLAKEGDTRLRIISGGMRPAGEVWMGKNWACVQAIDQATGDYVLFIDADVRLRLGSIETAVVAMATQEWDLLTGWLEIQCGCWGEWIAQPIIASMMIVGFQPQQLADPEHPSMFAVGPFMLFRRSAYDRVGGHRALRAEIVEDVELGRAIQAAGLRYHFAYFPDFGTLRMYRSFSGLWEGWTKNWHLGSKRNIKATINSAFISLLVFTMPWVGAIGGWVNLGHQVLESQITALGVLGGFVGLAALWQQYWIRLTLEQTVRLPKCHWWTSGIGGVVVAAIALASWIKTETGWGWTWRGRKLKLED